MTRICPLSSLFCRAITGEVSFEHSVINAEGRSLDIAGASYNKCVFNCAFIQLNTTRFGMDRLKDCEINASSRDKVFYLADNNINGEGYDIQNCVFNSRASSTFVSDRSDKMKSKTVFERNEFTNR